MVDELSGQSMVQERRIWIYSVLLNQKLQTGIHSDHDPNGHDYLEKSESS